MKCFGFPQQFPVFISLCNFIQTALKDQVGLVISTRDEWVLHPEEWEILLLLLLHLSVVACSVDVSKIHHQQDQNY